jgi:lipoprotein NlpI
MRVWASVAAFAACAVAAFAAAYDDFTLGQRANIAGDSDLAVTSFTNALNAPDLPPAYRPTAYVGRGTALARKGQCAQAQADAAAAIKLNPQFFAAHVLRVQMDRCLNDDAAVIADATAALAVHNDSWVRAMRAAAFWRQDDYAHATSDFEEASDLSPRDPFLALWAAASRMKTGTFDARRFTDRTRRFDEDEWPGPIIAFYRGIATNEAVRTAQKSGKAEDAAMRKCQADFFLGEWQLWKGDNAAAKELFASAASGCPDQGGSIGPAAKKELQRLS